MYSRSRSGLEPEICCCKQNRLLIWISTAHLRSWWAVLSTQPSTQGYLAFKTKIMYLYLCLYIYEASLFLVNKGNGKQIRRDSNGNSLLSSSSIVLPGCICLWRLLLWFPFQAYINKCDFFCCRSSTCKWDNRVFFIGSPDFTVHKDEWFVAWISQMKVQSYLLRPSLVCLFRWHWLLQRVNPRCKRRKDRAWWQTLLARQQDDQSHPAFSRGTKCC